MEPLKMMLILSCATAPAGMLIAPATLSTEPDSPVTTLWSTRRDAP